MKKIVISALIVIIFLLGVFILKKYTSNNDLSERKEDTADKVNNDENTVNIYDEQNNNVTDVSLHGRLRLDGTRLVDKNGEPYQLRGISTHGLQWYGQYISEETFISMKEVWNINVVRLAMYSDPNVGYNKELHKKVKEGIEIATKLGLYVIVDWHILSDGNPNTYKEQAIEFFKEIATLYKDNENIIYEICNEPNGNVKWEQDIKPYALDVIKQIRNIDKDSIIICGTPTWSQDVDIVANSKIEGYDNIMYALHFYAATHKEWLINKAQTAIDKGLPLFISEFSITDASGNGNIDYDSAKMWIDFINKNNLSFVMWNLSNKDETSALLSSSTQKLGNWTKDELSDTGRWLVDTLKNYDN